MAAVLLARCAPLMRLQLWLAMRKYICEISNLEWIVQLSGRLDLTLDPPPKEATACAALQTRENNNGRSSHCFSNHIVWTRSDSCTGLHCG